MNLDSEKPDLPDPEKIAEQIARTFGGVTDEASRRRAIRNWLLMVPVLTVLIPSIFYLRFLEVGPLGWGCTVFFDIYCLLWALGLYFLPKKQFHSKVKLRGDWMDRVAAFWLVGCAFGPLLGWVVTATFPITFRSWRWVYGARVFLAAGIPLLLALPMLRYVRGKAAWVSFPLLVLLTLIPASTTMQFTQDLWAGPTPHPSESGETEWYLTHTEHSLR